jgi:hypothetical protein
VHEFLSDEWFAAVEELGPPPPPPASGPGPGPDERHDTGAVNIVVTRDGADDVTVHVAGGTVGRGLVDDASTTVRTTFEVAKAVFLTGDQHAAMSAFIAGQVKVQGDLAALMALARTTPSPEQRSYARSILRLTTP